MVSEELIRVAILWHELWHEGLEEASRLFFGQKPLSGEASLFTIVSTDWGGLVPCTTIIEA